MDDFAEPIYACRNPECFGDGTAVAIRKSNVVKWYLDGQVPFMSRDELRSEIAASIALWSAVCDVEAVEVNTPADANVVITCVAMDGKGGVLADAMLPGPAVQRMRLDIAEGSLKHKMRAILCHEFGHIFGLQHFPVGPPQELMEPSISNIETPQPTEAALMAKWYGPPKPVAPSPTPAAPAGTLVCTMKATSTPDRFECDITAEQAGKKLNLKGGKPWA